MRHRVIQLCLPILLTAVAPAQVHATGRTPEEQLARMALALRTLSYEGVLVYAHEGRLETLHIVHRVEDGHVHEHLESLNGPVRTLIRDEGEVTCRLSGGRPFSVHSGGLGADLLGSKVMDPERLSPYYFFHPLGEERIAGRQTEVLGVIPRDEFRYGYRFYLDTDTGLPLKSDLMGGGARPLEQVFFTSLKLDSSPGPSPIPSNASVAKPASASADVVTSPHESTKPLGWRFVGLPAGFKLVMADRSPEGDGHSIRHFVLSDGLASLSVYVENGVEEGLSGSSRIGAINAVGGKVDGCQVTVIGEVPAVTVKAVLRGAVRTTGDKP